MNLQFTKMHGCGNDYIYFNCFTQQILEPEALSIKLSDRHKGIGGDGIIMILKSDIADAKMRMFNADGSEGKMCGNAIRCVAKYLYDYKMVDKTEITVETLSGVKTLQLSAENGEVTSVKVDMGEPILNPQQIPVNLPGESIISSEVQIGDDLFYITCVSMGNPHAVVFCDDVESLNLEKIGPQFEKNPIFPQQVNTEFIKIINKTTLQMRVWERGSGETLACGTGACASVVAAVLNGYCALNQDITVKLIGGELIINYTGKTVYMTGGSTKVFEGVVEI